MIDAAILETIEANEKEDAALDFKCGFDPSSAQDWCELIKDIVAMANSGGGLILFGVNDDGTSASTNLSAVGALDPAVIVDKIRKYTGQHFAGFSLTSGTRRRAPVVALSVSGVSIPMVFTLPGTYDAGGGKQKSAFSMGTVYFRHGAKSDPGTSDDLRAALERELERIRASWMDGIAKVVTAPVGATISVLPSEVHLSGGGSATAVRLVNDDDAPAFKAYRTDLLYPHRRKELVTRVNSLLGDAATITGHDVDCVRKVHGTDAQPNFYYKPQYSSPQYSEAFAEWLVAQYSGNPEFFHQAREALRSTIPTTTAL